MKAAPASQHARGEPQCGPPGPHCSGLRRPLDVDVSRVVDLERAGAYRAEESRLPLCIHGYMAIPLRNAAKSGRGTYLTVAGATASVARRASRASAETRFNSVARAGPHPPAISFFAASLSTLT